MSMKLTTAAATVAFLLSSNAQAVLGPETITFDDVVAGVPFYNYDSNDPDNNTDVIFSTTHADGFFTSGPGPDQIYVEEPALEGSSLAPEDLRVDFLQGAVGQVSFGFALIDAGDMTFTAYNQAGVAVGSQTVTGSCFDLDSGADLGPGNCLGGVAEVASPGPAAVAVGGISVFPEGEVIVPLSGTAVYGVFDADSPFGDRHIIDNFTFTPAGEDVIGGLTGSLPEDPLFGDVTINADGIPEFGFDVPVDENGVGGVFPIFIDPIYAVGYDYAITGASGHTFGSVLIPAALPNGDDTFTLVLPDGSTVVLLAGVSYDFTTYDPAGVDFFSILDIDISEGLDPADPAAFVTGLTYLGGSGVATTTMTPIVFDTDSASGGGVPVPAPLALLLLGFGGLMMAGRRKS